MTNMSHDDFHINIIQCNCRTFSLYISISYIYICQPPKIDVFESWQWVSQGCKDLKGLQTCIIPNHKISKRQVKNGRSLGGGTIQLPPPKIYHFQLFVDVKEVVFVGNLLQKQSRYTITFKKDEHILRSESTTFLEGSNLF